MRENVCIVLNAKNRKDALLELKETLDKFNEDCCKDTEFVAKYVTKSDLEKEYEDYKQQYRDLSEESKRKRIEREGLKDIEEYIQFVMDIFGWGTLEDYVRERYDIIRFDGEKCIGLYNPRGYIDYIDRIYLFKKYKYLKSTEIKKYGLSTIIRKDLDMITEDNNKSYKDNRLRIRQSLRNDAKGDNYIAIVRVHY